MANLNGKNTMANTYNFKFIIPVLAEMFPATEQLDRNDYILTVALVASAFTAGMFQEYALGSSFAILPYTKFQIQSCITDEEYEVEDRDEYFHSFIKHVEVHTIYLGSAAAKLATLECKNSHWKEGYVERYTFTLDPNMGRYLFKMLGLGSEALGGILSRRTSVGHILEIKGL